MSIATIIKKHYLDVYKNFVVFIYKLFFTETKLT